MRRARALGLALVLGLLPLLPVTSGSAARAGDALEKGWVPDPALMLDTADEGVVRLTELGKGPYVVVPIFTQCRAVCSRVAKALKSAWGEEGSGGASAQIVVVSFDPQDTRADMAHFRKLFDLPHSWHMATMEREEGLAFFSALGFQWRTLAQRQFDHSGTIFVLTDDLRIATALGASQLSAERLGAEVAAAAAGPSWVRRIGTHWVGFFGVGLVLLTLLVAVTWDKLRSRRPVATSV